MLGTRMKTPSRMASWSSGVTSTERGEWSEERVRVTTRIRGPVSPNAEGPEQTLLTQGVAPGALEETRNRNELQHGRTVDCNGELLEGRLLSGTTLSSEGLKVGEKGGDLAG